MSYQWLIKEYYPDPRPHAAAMLTTRKCNFECRSCCFKSGPRVTGNMSRADMARYLGEITKTSVKVISFTGGESTLFPDELDFGIGRARELGFITRLVTNGWWARSREKAASYMAHLRSQGLDELDISYDEFHKSYLPVEAIQHILDAGRDMDFRNICIAIVTNPNSSFQASEVLEKLAVNTDPALRAMLEARRLSLSVSGLANTGRASSIRNIKYWDEGSLLRGCSNFLNSIAINPNGDLITCCGGFLDIPALRIGNLHEEDIVSIFRRSSRNPLWKLIFYEGPVATARFIERLEPQWKLKDRFQNQCEACAALLSAQGRRYLHKYLPELREMATMRHKRIKTMFGVMDYMTERCASSHCLSCGAAETIDGVCCSTCRSRIRERIALAEETGAPCHSRESDEKFSLVKLLLVGIHSLARHGRKGSDFNEALAHLLRDFAFNATLEMKEAADHEASLALNIEKKLVVNNEKSEAYFQYLALMKERLTALISSLRALERSLDPPGGKGEAPGDFLMKALEESYRIFDIERKMEHFPGKDMDSAARTLQPFEDRPFQYYRTLILSLPHDLVKRSYLTESCLCCGKSITSVRLLCRECFSQGTRGKDKRSRLPRSFPSRPLPSDRFLCCEALLRKLVEENREKSLITPQREAALQAMSKWQEDALKAYSVLKAKKMSPGKGMAARHLELAAASEKAFISFVESMTDLGGDDYAVKNTKLLRALVFLERSEIYSQHAERLFYREEFSARGGVSFFPSYFGPRERSSTGSALP
ncbi:MAG: radical SAM protein [Candidatus Eremiobacteraeota bacterium]|nr:radical SAM protein [Candidatus Eremiobacteraeota bacterium]